MMDCERKMDGEREGTRLSNLPLYRKHPGTTAPVGREIVEASEANTTTRRHKTQAKHEAERAERGEAPGLGCSCNRQARAHSRSLASLPTTSSSLFLAHARKQASRHRHHREQAASLAIMRE
jgi:hypothetical protein